MPKYRARVSVTLPYKQRFSSVSVSSEVEIENEDLESAKNEAQTFVLSDVENLLSKVFAADYDNTNNTNTKSGPKRIAK
jgi:hypothetical protein